MADAFAGLGVALPGFEHNYALHQSGLALLAPRVNLEAPDPEEAPLA